MRIFMTGGSGLVGSALAQALVGRGDTVVVLSRAMRSGPDGMEFIGGRSTHPGSWERSLAGCDAVVHLAGEPIPHWRWSELHRRRIADSRILGTRGLVEALADIPADHRPRALVCASSVDIYPFDDGDDPYAEDAPPGEHFLATVCRDWEAEARGAAGLGLRVASLRSGIVIGRGRHSFMNLVTPWKLFFRGPVGSGEQWFSWVHVDDVVAAYLFAIDGELLGPANLVAPATIRQGDFARAVAAVMRRPVWEPVDETRLRVHVGDLADYLVRGRRAVPLALERAGFRFRRVDAPAALAASLDPAVEDDERAL